MKAQEILVTVAVPVYNGARYLSEAVDSALAQTHQHLEVLLYDDGSTDGSLALAQSFSDPRVKVLSTEENAGVGAARQALKTEARGDFIIWLDADDLYDERRVEVMLSTALDQNADVVIDNSRYIDESGEVLPGENRVADDVASDPFFTRLFERNAMNPHPMVSRACFEAIDFDPELTVSEDYDFWLKASWAGYRFCRLDVALHRYRLTSGSLSSRPEPARQAVQKIFDKYLVVDLKRLYRARGFSDEHVQYMACLQHLFRENYKAALAYATAPWPEDAEVDQDFYRGALELKCGSDEEAEDYLRQHLQRCPESPAGLNNLGVAMHRQGEDATDLWQQALALFPGYYDATANIDGNEALTLTQLAPRRHR